MKEYDIGASLNRIEKELIASMMRNMERHRSKEKDERKEWAMWQAEQLRALEEYKQRNRTKYKKEFARINSSIPALINEARKRGYLDQEAEILEAIEKGYKPRRHKGDIEGVFFKTNDRKLNALINATVSDVKEAETALLRRANDQYRKIIFDAQVYANTGAGTREKAIDMATKDFLSAGIQCVQYKNGAMHTLSDYADMAIRTASKRAYLQGEGEKRQEWGIHTVIMNKRGNPCPKCLPFVGKILIDDVWSGGPKDGKSQETGIKYPLMSKAVAAGLYHPRCKDSHMTYFEGISTPPDGKYTREEFSDIERQARQEAKHQYASRQAEKYGRLARYSLDPENQKMYGRKEKEWRHARFKTGNMTSKEYAVSKMPLENFRAVPENHVVDTMRKDSEEWIESLTSKEKHAIRKYTYNSGDKKPNRFFERLNTMLRGDIAEDKKLKEYADIISGALQRNRLNYDVVCYRNMSINPIGERKPGSILKFNQFTSTSVIQGRALNNKYKLVIYAPKGTKGAYIEKISEFPNQRELLIDKDCIYRVLSNKGNEIELEVLP